ncbi:MAG TPA: hypothetical protein PLJ10_00340 [Candidatus Hydrogenedens sp.]|nr:hypothetical protein [Candidatus Hydrogenedens sp.]
MFTKKTLIILATLLIVLIFFSLSIKPAYAAAGKGDALGADKDLASKKGISGSLATKQFDKNKLPGKWKIGFAFGSLAAAVAVVKWL